MENIKLSIVIPVLNEEGNVGEVYKRILRAIATSVETLEIIFVDDGSIDNTAEIIVELHKRDPRVCFVKLTRNFGHQVALMAGLDHARGDVVVCMDGDLQHPPELLPQMLEHWQNGIKVVHAVREYDLSTSWFKRQTSKFFYFLMQRITNLRILTAATDFYLLDRHVVDIMKQCKTRIQFTRGLIPWLGFKREIVSYCSKKRYSGVSKYSLAKMVALALDGIFGFSIAPLRFVGILGLLTTMIGLLYLFYAISVRLFGSSTVPGWASLVAAVISLGGVQLISLWVIGEYVARITQQTRGWPLYLTETILLGSSKDIATTSSPSE